MSTQQRRVARRIGLAGLAVAFAVALGGCTSIQSIVSRPPAPKVTIPPPPPVKREPAPPPPAKKEPEAPQPAKKEPEAPPPVKETPPPPTKAPAPAPPPPPPAKEPAPPPPAKKEPEAPQPAKKEPETAPPVLAPQVGKGDEEQLKRTAGSRIQRTEQVIGQLEGKKLTGDQREQLLTVQNLLGSAKEALAAQDLAKASNLAEKARILAEELSQVVK